MKSALKEIFSGSATSVITSVAVLAATWTTKIVIDRMLLKHAEVEEELLNQISDELTEVNIPKKKSKADSEKTSQEKAQD